MRWTLPNTLTVLRLVAAPGLAAVYLLLARPAADWAALALFVAAAATDWIDGRIARRRGLESRFGAMLDPIADKAMVLIALAILLALSGMNPLLLVPVTLIVLREVFVSGLREFLGDDARHVAVTRLAKWKTTVQMAAIVALFLAGIAQLDYEALYYANEPAHLAAILAGETADDIGLVLAIRIYEWVTAAALVLIWAAGLLTFATGIDYLRKALPYLSEERT